MENICKNSLVRGKYGVAAEVVMNTITKSKEFNLPTIVKNFAVMVAILLATILFSEILDKLGVSNSVILVIYLMCVIIISRITPSYFYGVVAAIAATFSYNFLIMEPRMSVSLSAGLPLTLIMMLSLTIIISTMTIQIKAQADLSVRREHMAELFYEISQKLMAADDIRKIEQIANEYLTEYIENNTVFYSADPLANENIRSTVPSPFNAEDEIIRVHRIFQSGEDEIDTEEPGVKYVSASTGGSLRGVIGVDCTRKELNPECIAFLNTFSGQLAMALELQILSDEKNHAAVEAETEKMRSVLLRSISHDLRTPLTSILGASDAIIEGKDMDRVTVENFARDISNSAQWLIRMIENLLTVTKISKEKLEIAKKPEAAEEVAAQAVSIVRSRFPGCHIHVKVEEELLMVPMDATLISQVIINLLENAAKNSPENGLILFNVSKQGNCASFSISDSGKGIPESALENLFEPCAISNGPSPDSSRGLGIGLSICQAIVKAHGGKIDGRNREDGGARFCFTLPLEVK